MGILIFKTNILNEDDFNLIKSSLAKVSHFRECTVDFEDEDKVLRLVSNTLTVDRVEREVDNLGFFCKEMKD